MTRPFEIQQIEATLGPTFDTVRRLSNHAALYASLPADEDTNALTDRIAEHCVRWNAMGYTVFVGFLEGDRSHGIFAFFNANPVQLMEIFNVGSHNDFFGHTPNRAQRYMRKLYETDKFVPYFIDAAGFKVRFIKPVSAVRAREIEKAIMDFDPDACDSANEAAILQKQKLELWWD
jgi:hypothetical protein